MLEALDDFGTDKTTDILNYTTVMKYRKIYVDHFHNAAIEVRFKQMWFLADNQLNDKKLMIQILLDRAHNKIKMGR